MRCAVVFAVLCRFAVPLGDYFPPINIVLEQIFEYVLRSQLRQVYVVAPFALCVGVAVDFSAYRCVVYQQVDYLPQLLFRTIGQSAFVELVVQRVLVHNFALLRLRHLE